MKARIDNEGMAGRVYRWLLASVLAFAPLVLVAVAQSQTATPPAPKRPALPEDEIAGKMQAARNDPAQYIELLVQLVREFPDSNRAEGAGFSFASTIKKQLRQDKDAAKLRPLAARFIEGTSGAPSQLRVRINSSAVSVMLDNGLAQQAVELAQQTTPLLDEKEYVAFARRSYERDIAYASKANPDYKPRPFVEADFTERFLTTKASYYALLGRAYFKLNNEKDAEQAYRLAFEIEPNATAAVGLGTILEKRGLHSEALDYMARGVLTGKLDKDGLARFRELYGKTHGGKLDGVEEYLNARFRQTYRNPVKREKHSHEQGETGRTVLVEFFTGAGCVPCMPFDYSFETSLHDYSRKELTLLVYHWHAPTMDPLGNRSSDARVKYYGVRGAPTIFIDGKKFESKDDDNRNKSKAGDTAQRLHPALKSRINADLRTPLQGQIRLGAKRVGGNVEVNVTADPLKGISPEVSLQIALIENEVHYSGENGLRFHFMVVRNLARRSGAEDYGFKVDPAQSTRIEYVFDINDIAAQNLLYYTEHPKERWKEFESRVGAEAAKDTTIDFSFKEHKNLINPDNLSVVAFLQDNKTKEILQSTYFRLAPTRERKNVARR